MLLKTTQRPYHFVMLAAIAMFTAAFVLSGCDKSAEIKNRPLHKVVVLHSWSDRGEEGRYFQDIMDDEFVSRGFNVEAHHFYCDMTSNSPELFAIKSWPAIRDSINSIQPELFLLNDDPIVDALMRGYIKDSLLMNTPKIFAGVNSLQREYLDSIPLMTGLEDRVELVKNLMFITNVTDKYLVNIELDHNGLDSILRRQFVNMLLDSVKFANNSDFHIPIDDYYKLMAKKNGKMVVTFTSVSNPLRNSFEGKSDTLGMDYMLKMFKMSKDIPQLQVKYDIFSNSIIDRSGTPQFTCIREQFNNEDRTRFLGGFFTSTENQIKDQIDYAVRIFNGENPKQIYIGNHSGDYYLDWNAMREYSTPLSYSEYALKYNIVNAPLLVTSPGTLMLYIVIAMLIIIIGIWVIVYYYTKWRNGGQRELVDILTYEEKIHKLLFTDAHDTTWCISNDVMYVERDFAEYFKLPLSFPMSKGHMFVHPESHGALERLRNFRETRGRKRQRMKLTPDGQTWYWVEVMYNVTEQAARKNEIHGLLFNIDSKKAIEEQLEQAQLISSEVALKENFLANISHDLKTPLGAITGFSEMLTIPEMQLTDEDRAEYCAYIHQNTEMILSMIDDVMKKARTPNSDADLEIVQKPVEISRLINDCYQTNNVIVPSHLELKLVTDEPDCMINIDLIRTKQVVNNFLSNAFKFTPDGSITLAWRHIDAAPDGWVEVSVTDTGIGIDPASKDKLFDRYVKVNETDKGTGLGLNISKSIVERQGGLIGVDSEIGKGSKFFFLLRKYVQCLAVALTMALGALSTSSCTFFQSHKVDANVLIIHSYDKQYYAYPQFNEEVRYNLVKHDVSPKIRHIYLDLEDPRTDMTASYEKQTDALKEAGFKPDIILAEGDRAAKFMLDRPFSKISIESRDMPIVLGALHHPEWERIRQHPNMVAINDPIDYVTNLNLAVKFGKSNVVTIELDHFPIDSMIVGELQQAISRPPFVDNTDHHLRHLDYKQISTDLKDSIIVLTYSVAEPRRNSVVDTISTEEAFQHLGSFLQKAWYDPSLSLKRDIYSREIMDKTGRPQFTAISAGFGDPNSARYLCGYFSSYTTVASDLATVAAALMKGTKPSELTGRTHEKGYYMDYNAMKVLGMKYSSYNDEFEIVNAPMQETAPLLYYTIWSLVIIVLLAACGTSLLVAKSWKDRSKNDIVESVKRRATIRSMALNGVDSRTVRSEDAMKEVLSTVHSEYAQELPLIHQAMEISGSHFYDIYADVEQTGDYHWWQVRFAVVFDKYGKHVDGILFNIDGDKKREQDLKLAIELAEEAKQKEDFLTTISHELRTPLNAVVGFSDVMATLPRDQVSDEELHTYGQIIKTNNNLLRGMIEDILMFSRIESHRIKYISKEFVVKGLIEELVEEWKPLMPEGVRFHVFCLEPEMVMNNDRARVKYVLSQMLSNAVKFTKSGVILLGALYHHNDQEVEFIVGDTGCGIAPEKQTAVFGLFWKDDEFVPGLGLGLNIAQKLADGMGLRIKCESTLGYGTKMLVFGKARLNMDLVDRTKFTSPQLSSDSAII